MKVLPGTKVPADGTVEWGSSYVNESMVTGESIPVLKEVNSSVIGGTISLHGVLHIRATKVGSDAVLSQIISLVETAQMSKAPIQKFADFVSTLTRQSCGIFDNFPCLDKSWCRKALMLKANDFFALCETLQILL